MASSYDSLVQSIEFYCSTSGKLSFESGPVRTDRGEMSLTGSVLDAPLKVVDITGSVDPEYWTDIETGIYLPDYRNEITAAVQAEDYAILPAGAVRASVTLLGFDHRAYTITLIFDPTHDKAYRIKPSKEFAPVIVVEVKEKLAQCIRETLERILAANPADDLERYENMFGMLDYYLQSLHDGDWQ